MLRITRGEESADRATLLLEGTIGAEWAELLERECAARLRTGTAVSLDLSGVLLIGTAGLDALARLDRAGVEIRCRPGAVLSVLEAEGLRVTLLPGPRAGKGGGATAG